MSSGYTPWSPQATYDENGYATGINALPNTTNPWNAESMFSQTQGATNKLNQGIANQTSQMNAYASGGGYPAMQNSYGLGTQTPSAPAGTQSNVDYMSSPISQGTPDSSSRGFNPWSLSGEALSRG